MKIKTFVFVIYLNIIFFPVFGFEREPGIPFIRYYSTRDYNGGIQNWSITQDKSGLIYVANNFGVLEYDGSTWNRYAPKTGTKVRHLAIDKDGRIYVASQGDFGFLFPNEE